MSGVRGNFVDCKYATKHGVDLWLRVFIADAQASEESWLFWIHGGAWASGQHFEPHAWLVPICNSLNSHLVSVSHRFSPICGVEEIKRDLRVAYQWCRVNLASVVSQYRKESRLDVDRYWIGGESSGAAMAMLLAMELEPRPRVVVDMYGSADMQLQQKHFEDQPPNGEWKGTLSEEELKKMVADRDQSHAYTITPFLWDMTALPEEVVQAGGAKLVDVLKKKWKTTDREWSLREQDSTQAELKRYMAHMKIGLPTFFRLNPGQSEKEVEAIYRKYSATHLVASAKGDEPFPPAVLMHGVEDQAVPVALARGLAEVLRSRGVDYVELYEPGAGHGWDVKYTGPEVEGWDKYIAPVAEFAKRYLE